MNNKKLEKATIQDIAKHAGVGQGTVSRVLNDHPNVSQRTRDKVLQAIEELSYRPRSIARQMRTQRSHLIGFVTDYVATSPFAGEIIHGAQSTAWDENRILLVVNAGQDGGITEAAIEALLERDVEGIIYAAMYHHAITPPENIREVPSVLVNCYPADRTLPSVVPDEFLAGRTATEILLAKGHRRVGFINVYGVNPGIPASVGRLRGYQEALASYNIPFDEALVRHGIGEAESGYVHTLDLMAQASPPTAIFCGNDRTAMGAYNALNKLSLRIPDDVAIMGFDNQEVIAAALKPPLSTMQLPHYEMGSWGINFLLEHIEGDAPYRAVQHKLDCPFIERNSI
jgi:LacI family transcriptional regulator